MEQQIKELNQKNGRLQKENQKLQKGLRKRDRNILRNQ